MKLKQTGLIDGVVEPLRLGCPQESSLLQEQNLLWKMLAVIGRFWVVGVLQHLATWWDLGLPMQSIVVLGTSYEMALKRFVDNWKPLMIMVVCSIHQESWRLIVILMQILLKCMKMKTWASHIVSKPELVLSLLLTTVQSSNNINCKLRQHFQPWRSPSLRIYCKLLFCLLSPKCRSRWPKSEFFSKSVSFWKSMERLLSNCCTYWSHAQ